MSYYWMMALAYTIFVPAVTGLIRLRSINVVHYPFILLLWIGGANEIISYFTAKYLHNSAPNTNVYSLIEVAMVLWQFKRWHIFEHTKYLFPATLGCLVITWIAENFVMGSFLVYNSYFIIISSLAIVITSIAMVNRLLVTERKKLSANPVFIISICFIIFYTYDATEELLWKYGVGLSLEMSSYIYDLFIYINLAVYIFYSYAILCMRRKSPFTMPS